MSEKKKKVNLKVGQKVIVQEKEGTVRFIGETEFSTGVWVGIELDVAEGKNDGSVKGVKYFSCKDNYGIFARAKACSLPKKSTKKKASKKKASKKKAPSSSTKSSASPSKPAGAAPTTHKSSSSGMKEKEDKLKALQKRKLQLQRAKGEEPVLKSSDAELTKKLVTLEKQLAHAKAEVSTLKDKLQTATKAGGNTSMADIQAATEKKLLAELTELENKYKESEARYATAQSDIERGQEVPDLQLNLKKLEATVAELRTEKDDLAEQFADAKEELDTVKDEAEIYKLELEEMQAVQEESKEELLASLPTDQAEVAALADKNRQLTEALRKLRDQSLSVKERFDNYKSDTTEEINSLSERAAKVPKLEQALRDLKETVTALKTSVDAAGQFEEMVEELTEEKMIFREENKQLKLKVEHLDSLSAVNEEVEEGHLEYELQLQTELDAKEVEVAECYRQLKLKQSMIEDLNVTQRQFRSLVKDLENEQSDLKAQGAGAGGAESGGGTVRKDHLRKMQMQARVSDMKSKAVSEHMARLEAQQATLKFHFLESYIPDNVNVDHAGLELRCTLGRLQFKATAAAQILHSHYGSATHNERLSAFSYAQCQKLIDFAKTVRTTSHGLRFADETAYLKTVGERESLESAEAVLDEFSEALAQDNFSDELNVDGLTSAQENVIGFLQANFSNYDDSGEARLSFREPVSVELDLKALSYQVAQVGALLQAVADEFMGIPKAEEGAPADNYAALFDKLRSSYTVKQDACTKALNQARTFQLLHGSKTNILNHTAAEVKSCSSANFACSVRVQQLLEWVREVLRGGGEGDDATRRKLICEQLEVRLEGECGEKRLLDELNASLAHFQNLAEKLQGAPEEEGEAVSAMPLWESKASDVRKELMQAANVQATLEEQTRRLEAKSNEAFHASKQARDRATQIDVITQRMANLEEKAKDADELRAQLEKSKKLAKDYSQASDTAAQDMDKYSRANKALRRKVLKLKYDLKREQEAGNSKSLTAMAAGSGALTASGKELGSLRVAAAEVNNLLATVGVLRRQLAQSRAARAKQDLSAGLPTLPMIASIVHAPDHHSAAENAAIASQRSASLSPFHKASAADIQVVHGLSQEVKSLGSRVSNFRSTAALIDLTAVAAGSSSTDTPGQRWLGRQKEANNIKVATSDLTQRLSDFLSSKQSQAFRSLLSMAPAQPIGAPGKLIGRVTVPSAVSGSSSVVIGRRELLQLQSVLAC